MSTLVYQGVNRFDWVAKTAFMVPMNHMLLSYEYMPMSVCKPNFQNTRYFLKYCLSFNSCFFEPYLNLKLFRLIFVLPELVFINKLKNVSNCR